jgi:hypothetical protein
MELRMQNCKPSLGATLLFVFAIVYPAAGQAQSEKPEFKCETGPISRTYGGMPWYIYSCNDGLSITIVSAPGNPAAPSYFVVTPQDDRYHLYDERTGNIDASDAALKEIQNLSKRDVTALIAATKAQKPAPEKP